MFKKLAANTLVVALILAIAQPAVAQLAPSSAASQPYVKSRLIVLSDIEADPDDTQSFVRLFLYANEIDIEGLVATTSVHQKGLVAPDSIRSVIDAYGEVQPNLLKHDKGFPDAKSLAALVTQGLPVYGMAGVGKGKDSPGSDAIIHALEKNDPRPLWVTIWGGANTLAQALCKIKQTRTPEAAARLTSKLRVYAISDQDDSGIWIRKTFPDIFYIVSPGGYGNATWGGMNNVEPGFDNSEISNEWIARNIQQGHGPLGAKYPDVGYALEGDTPSFLSLIPNGLNAPEHPDWGGWGGRYVLYAPDRARTDPDGFTGGVPVEVEPRPIWTNAVDSYTPYVPSDFGRNVKPFEKTATGFKTTIWRWRKDIQNDFAARMEWTTKSFKETNHPPVPALGHSDHLTVKSGGSILLSAAGSTDPDGDSLSYLWFNYPEAGSLKEPVKFLGAENLYRVHVQAPVVTKPETVQFILKVTDKGAPPLTRYKRVFVTIVP